VSVQGVAPISRETVAAISPGDAVELAIETYEWSNPLDVVDADNPVEWDVRFGDDVEVRYHADSQFGDGLVTDGGQSTTGTNRERGYGWICTGCKKIVSSQPFGPCHDCGGHYRPATDEDPACDRCEDEDGRRLLDRTGEFDRLCPSCIDEVVDA
jgi:hypothetical protein